MFKFAFVIDTNSYAGNFEREMAAYLTGEVGECGVGEEEADSFPKGSKVQFSNVAFHADENGCRRPVEIYPTPGMFNHGMGGNFKDGQEKAALKDYIKVTVAYHKEHQDSTKRIKKILLSGEPYSNWTLRDCERDIADEQKEIDKARNTKKVTKHPAYCSVAIYFSTSPSPEQIALMKRRAALFAKQKEHKFKITGFRVVTNQKSTSEKPV